MADSVQSRRWWILSAVLVGTLLGTGATSMVTVALPSIMDALGVGLSSATWVITIFVLSLGVLMPIYGRLGDMYGTKRIYLAGTIVFTLACFLAAASRQLETLLIARTLQGIGSAPTMPSVMAIITHTFPERERGRAMGLWATMNGIGHGLGPVVGGNLAQYFGWPAVFVALGGLGVVGAVAIWQFVPGDARRAPYRFDAAGAILLGLTVLSLMLNLTQGAKAGWTAGSTLALWLACGVFLAAFVAVESRVRLPFVDLRLFVNRRYAAALSIFSIEFFSLYGVQLLLPLFFMTVQRFSPGQAGWLIAPLSITSALVAPFAGRLSDSLGFRRLCGTGMGLVAVAGAALSFSQVGTTPAAMVGMLILLGIGLGLVQSPIAAAVTFTVERERLGIALGLFNMFRMISASLGTTVFGILLVQGASPAAPLGGYHLAFYVLIAVALIAVALAGQLPRPGSEQSDAAGAGDHAERGRASTEGRPYEEGTAGL